MSAALPALELGFSSQPDVLHVITLETYTDEAIIWTMFCGESCFVDDDGETTPPLDFYHPNFAYKATCNPCRVACGLPPLFETQTAE